MAWYRCGGGSGKDRPIYKTLKMHSGKINIRNGTIESDDTYYYTDAIPFSSDITFDMGLAQTGLNYDGIALYDSSDVWVDFYAVTQRYRNISYSGNATICRLSFRASNLHYIMFHDWINNIMYSTEEVVKITDDEDVPLGTKTISENGTYSAQDDGLLGYSEVTVDVAGGNMQTQFRYLKWHITDNGNNNNVLQMNEVEFRNENDVAFTMPTGFIATSSMSPYVPEDDAYVLFDGTDRKLVILPWVSGTSVEDITIDLGEGNYLDITDYPYFCWKSGGDDSQYFGRAPRVWQLYGANQSDFSDAVLLDDTTIPINTQNNIWCYKSRMMLYDSYQLGTKTITENGTYSAKDDGVDGYSEVMVNVDAISPSPALPAEYQRVEYLDIQGGYFEVDLPNTATYEATFATSESSTTRKQGVLGTRMSTTSNTYGDWYIYIDTDLSKSDFWVRGDIYTAIVPATNLSVDVPVTVLGNASTKAGAHNFIGAYNPYDGGTYKTAKYEFYGKLYKLTGYQPSLTGPYVLNTVCDFIPCYRKSDDQVGVYDVIADTFYTPTLLTVGGVQGTVTAGPDVNE